MQSRLIAEITPHLISYFGTRLPELKNTYKWSISKKPLWGNLAGKDDYHSNLKLKQLLSGQWSEATTEHDRLVVARKVISDWGGINRISDTTLKKHINLALNQDDNFSIDGVASYSKLLAIADPDKYAIYDARVAVSLNAIQDLTQTKGVYFQYLKGRNKITGDQLKKRGFVFTYPFTEHDLLNQGWYRIPKNDVYITYINLLRQCASELKHDGILDLEMILFSDAEKLALEATKQRGVSLQQPN